jgi:Zn-dependent M28 family amino/carboxypeptidase
MPGSSLEGPLPPLDASERELAERLRVDVTALAGPGEHNTMTPAMLVRAEGWVTAALADAGYDPKRLAFASGERDVANVEATHPGGARAKEVVVVGAHYDSAMDAPGADDNASGVAAMLAIARTFSRRSPSRTIRFVAFTNEEPPHFWQKTMGSLVYAKSCRERGDDVVAMLSLESIGYYRDEPGSQKYPPIVRLLYPDRGDFLAFVGNVSSRGLVRDAIRTFRATRKLPSEGAAMPSFVEGVGWSDQWSFWQVGYDGVMITDTAPFRNPSYHTPHDTPDTLDYERLARAVSGLTEVLAKLVE